jgi:signal transduction histidine kinase/DNA-binding response OmpR family regulator
MATVAVFLVQNFKYSLAAEEARLQSVASIFGAVLSDPLSSGNQSASRNVLRALKDMPSVIQASVHDKDGLLVAEMGGGAVLEKSVLHSSRFKMTDLMSIETLEISQQVVKGGAKAGTLTLVVDISWMRGLFWKRLFFATLFAAGAVAAGSLVAQRLVKRATKRLSDLSGALSSIGKAQTLTYNFKRETDDEVGVVIDAVNDMMGRIDERDKALRKHSESLEDKVKERTAELVTARDEAERANAAKSEFLSMMSHEIRTPMNGMMVMAQMLAAAPLSPRHLRFAEIINRSGQNLLAIINDVLDISKIESGKLMLENSPFSIDDLFADVFGLFAERARERGVFLGYTISPQVPRAIIADATRLNQIVTNLVNNALKFTERGSVILHASSQPAAGGHMISISVSDTGIGIAADKLASVFERFSQADQSITRRFGGTGLGLAICKRLAEAMGGSVSVKSIEGKGSTFTAVIKAESEENGYAANLLHGKIINIQSGKKDEEVLIGKTLELYGARLDHVSNEADLLIADSASIDRYTAARKLLLVPAMEIAEVTYRTRGRLEIASPVSRAQIQALASAFSTDDFSAFRNTNKAAEREILLEGFRGLRALAVDDNQVNREVLTEALTSIGFQVDAAANGKAALQFAGQTRYDIIFMDCSMPVMDGFTATRILREREAETGHRTPVVAITALAEGNGERNWRKAGMDGWISKPFTIPSISERVKALVLNHGQGAAPGSSAAPLLDEPTVGMITRLSSAGDGSAAVKIHQLFSASANASLVTISQAARENNSVLFAETAKQLASVAGSAGARQLAEMAALLGEMRGVKDLDQEAEKLLCLFKQSDRALRSRFGLIQRERTEVPRTKSA